MIIHERKSVSGFSELLARLKNEISRIIVEGPDSERASEVIVEEILRRTVFDNELVIMTGTRAERPVTMADVIFIARKALDQAAFDGAHVILPSGEKVNRKKSYSSFSS